ncbi:MAG: hypothetical protein PHE43_03790 [Candidatus Nanoarchaeia archaeon]|nr:hypothetical protein [Candidatus Nanoarchaeia archaeon]
MQKIFCGFDEGIRSVIKVTGVCLLATFAMGLLVAYLIKINKRKKR